MSVRIEELVIFVDDVKTAATFYERVFGFARIESAFREEQGVILDAAGLRLALQSHEISSAHGGEPVAKLSKTEPAAPFELSFAVDDVDATYALALESGAADLEPPHDTKWGDRIAHFRDPSGVLIGLSRPPP